jgi:hypothetical protein
MHERNEGSQLIEAKGIDQNDVTFGLTAALLPIRQNDLQQLGLTFLLNDLSGSTIID